MAIYESAYKKECAANLISIKNSDYGESCVIRPIIESKRYNLFGCWQRYDERAGIFLMQLACADAEFLKMRIQLCIQWERYTTDKWKRLRYVKRRYIIQTILFHFGAWLLYWAESRE